MAVKKIIFTDKGKGYDNLEFRYLLGIDIDYALMIWSDSVLYVFLDARYIDISKDIDSSKIRKRVNNENLQIEFVLLDTSMDEKIKSIVDKDKVIVSKSVPFRFYQKMSDKYDVSIGEDFLNEFRVIKQSDEVENMKKSINIMDIVFSDIKNMIASGKIFEYTEDQLRRFIVKRIFELGGEGESFTSIIASNRGSSIPHYQTANIKLSQGVLLIDSGAVYNGYCSDFTRTYRIGQCEDTNDEYKKIYQIVKDAYNLAVDAVKPGMIAKDLDKIARDYISDKGYGKCFGHSLGHGIGLSAHEIFGVGPRSNAQIREGMFLTIEPGIYLPDICGVRLENTVYITEHGAEVFSQDDI